MEQYSVFDSKKKSISSAKDMGRRYEKKTIVIEKVNNQSYILIIDPEDFLDNYEGADEFTLNFRLKYAISHEGITIYEWNPNEN